MAHVGPHPRSQQPCLISLVNLHPTAWEMEAQRQEVTRPGWWPLLLLTALAFIIACCRF